MLPPRLQRRLVFLTCAVGLACGPVAEPTPSPSLEDPAPAQAFPDLPKVIFLGDSLTAGLGLPEGETYPALLEERLEAAGRPVEVINAGVSGDTSAGGLARLDWLLAQEPDVLVVELGPNDGLRGLDLAETEKNLREIVTRARAAGARVLLTGLQLPPNYGPEYTRDFRALYPKIAEDLDVPLVPFLLEGVGGEPELNLPDGIHPNARGHRRLADNVQPYLEEILEELADEANLAPHPGLKTRAPPAASRWGFHPPGPSSPPSPRAGAPGLHGDRPFRAPVRVGVSAAAFSVSCCPPPLAKGGPRRDFLRSEGP